VAKQAKELKEKAKKARSENKGEAAAQFRAGAKRLQRRLRASAVKERRKRGKSED
jgi:hypothetical protein